MFDPQRPLRITFRLSKCGGHIEAILCLNVHGAEDSNDSIVLSTLDFAASQDAETFKDWRETLQRHLVRFTQALTKQAVSQIQIIQHSRPKEN